MIEGLTKNKGNILPIEPWNMPVNTSTQTEYQIKRLKAAANALMVAKRNPKYAPLLKGVPIMGVLRRAQRNVFAVQSGILLDEEYAKMLEPAANLLELAAALTRR